MADDDWVALPQLTKLKLFTFDVAIIIRAFIVNKVSGQQAPKHSLNFGFTSLIW